MVKTIYSGDKRNFRQANPMEITIVNSILKWLNGLPGCRAIKTHGDERRSGEPDIYACLDGHFIVVEVKRPGFEPTPLQQAILELWERAGATSLWVTSLDELKQKLEELKIPKKKRG